MCFLWLVNVGRCLLWCGGCCSLAVDCCSLCAVGCLFAVVNRCLWFVVVLFAVEAFCSLLSVVRGACVCCLLTVAACRR